MDIATISYYSKHAASVAERYEGVVNSLSAHFDVAFLNRPKVLDIGCGSGRDLAALKKLGHDCFGVDPTEEFVTLSQKLHPELSGRVIAGSLPELLTPFGGDFDGILCSAVLMHIEVGDLAASAMAIKRCLKVGGRLLYSVPSKRLDLVTDSRDVNGRLFIPDQSDRLQLIFEGLGFQLISRWMNTDSMGRDSVEWESVLLERTVD